MANKPVLGKGLASLLSNAAPPQSMPPQMPPFQTGGAGALSAGPQVPVDFSNRDRHPGISLAAIEEIVANAYQPRHDFDEHALEELAQSIRENGIIQPLVVRKSSEGYQLIAGERRLRAAKRAGLKQVPVVIRKTTDRESLELALIENIQRQDLNCVDEALAYQQLITDFMLTQEVVAQKVGKDRATIANHLRLLRLPELIIQDLKKKVLSFGHGKALLQADSNDLRIKARNLILERKLSVRETEALMEELMSEMLNVEQSKPALTAKSPLQSRLSSLSQELSRQYSAKVEIKGNERRGKIILHYSNREELDRILSEMQNA